MRPVRDLVVAVSGACQLALRDAVEPSDRGVVGLRRGAERCDLLWFEQARRAAPDVERADTRPAEPHALARDLVHKRRDVSRAEPRGRGRGGEIAVGTARRAERYVDIDGDPAHRTWGALPPIPRIDPNGSGSPASAESSAVRPRSISHSRDSCTKASK